MSSRSAICGVPIGIYSFFYIITYFIKNVKCNRYFGSIWIGVRLWRIPYVDPNGISGFGNRSERPPAAGSTRNFPYGVSDRKFGTWPPTRARRTPVRSNICSRLVVPNPRAPHYSTKSPCCQGLFSVLCEGQTVGIFSNFERNLSFSIDFFHILC